MEGKKFIKIMKEYTSLKIFYEAYLLYEELIKIEDEFIFRIALLYQLGVIEGKRQERAKRKGGVMA